MSQNLFGSIICAGLMLAASACSHNKGKDLSAAATKSATDGWTDHFDVPQDQFSSVGRNSYVVLEPGYQMVLESKTGRLVITVLDETKTLDGVETRIVEERESEDGQLVEVSRNYFAIDRRNSDVYYFGEDVDMYKNGAVSGHGGSWYAGVNGAHFGLAMPASPKVGQRYYQEVAPGSAMDRAEVVSTSETMHVPAGDFTNCVKTRETTPIEPGEKEYKVYAPGVGLLNDESMKLSKYGPKSK